MVAYVSQKLPAISALSLKYSITYHSKDETKIPAHRA